MDRMPESLPPRQARPPRWLRAVRLALFLLPLASAHLAVPARADTSATVVPADGLNLRAGPSTAHRVLELIPAGTRIAIVGVPTADGWYPAVYRGQRGWVLGAYVVFDEWTAATVRRATVLPADGLNLRSAPLEGAPVVAVLPAGTVVTAARATADDWALVLVGERSGWVKAVFLAFEAPLPAAGPPAGTDAAPAGATGAGIPMKVTYYDPALEGNRLACGGIYRGDDPTIAAATRWPCGTVLRVCRAAACVTVTVRDTGAMGLDELDLSAAAFQRLAPLGLGLIHATVEVVGP